MQGEVGDAGGMYSHRGYVRKASDWFARISQSRREPARKSTEHESGNRGDSGNNAEGTFEHSGSSPAVPLPVQRKPRRLVPGFSLSLGFAVAYLSLIVLIPLAMVFVKT